MKGHYHIQHFGPTDPWPKGGWSLYQINGDQIAQSVVRERVNPKGWYEGDVIARHPWPGYIGIFATLEELAAAIAKAEGDQ